MLKEESPWDKIQRFWTFFFSPMRLYYFSSLTTLNYFLLSHASEITNQNKNISSKSSGNKLIIFSPFCFCIFMWWELFFDFSSGGNPQREVCVNKLGNEACFQITSQVPVEGTVWLPRALFFVGFSRASPSWSAPPSPWSPWDSSSGESKLQTICLPF